MPSRQAQNCWDSKSVVNKEFNEHGFSEKRVQEYHKTAGGGLVEVDLAYDETEIAKECTTIHIDGKIKWIGDHKPEPHRHQ